MEGTFVFAPVITEEQWGQVPSEIGAKLASFVEEKFEEFITSKALLETRCSDLESNNTELKSLVESLQNENEELKSRLESATLTLTEFEAQVSTLTSELNKLQTQSNALEAEAAEYRHQRNLAVDERDEHLKMIQRRNMEVERMQIDINTLTKQLEDAVNAKCEALAQADEVHSMKISLEYKEKRLEQERSLMQEQIDSYSEELHQRTEELLNMRRDNTSRCIQLETQLTERTQELTVANEQIKSLMELNKNMTTINEELQEKMNSQRETNMKMNESYVCEVEAKSKLATVYKNGFDESQKHAEELQEMLTEVQQLLKTATDQYGDLETKHKESELANEEIIAKKNECIAMLKKELETANELLENAKQDQIHRDIEGLSPTATRLNKTGYTYTEIYSKYVNVSEQLSNKDKECARLNNYISCIVREIEEKGPLIKKLRQDYSDTLDANEALKASNDALLNDLQQLREANMDVRKKEGQFERENQRLKKEVADLSRQVVHLLQEVEHSRVGGSSSTSTDNDLSDSISSADIISKRLVTFNDTQELVSNNQKLLALVRELSERQEEVESFDPAAISNLKMKLELLTESHNELLEEKEQHNKMMVTLRNQRDMYQNLYTQAVKGSGDDIPMTLEGSFNNETSRLKNNESDVKNNDNEEQINKLKKELDQLKEEGDMYRKEKSANEKILLEQLETMRKESKELTSSNCKLTSQIEMFEEKFKVLQNNVEIYKKQITALEKQNKIYSDSIVKHEQAATYLKEETLQSQTKLSKAEVMLGHLQKENALLKDSESRLLKERESLKRESHQQNLIRTNIELIKATLERTDAEGKLRLEARLDEAHRECAALRRRLQEEQTHFRQLSEHLEKQTKEAQKRALEEKEQNEKLLKETTELREEIISKTNQIDDLSKKLKSSVFSMPDSSQDGKRIRELEQMLSDSESEINALKSKLKTTKEACEEYCKIAEGAELQVKEVVEREDALKKELEERKVQIRELQEKCSELEGELSIQLDDQDITAAGKPKSIQLQEELNIRNMDLKTAKEQLESARSEIKALNEQLKASENKYAREVTLHSVDLKALTEMKEELDKALNEIQEINSAKIQAIEALEQSKISWEEQERLFQNERDQLNQRFKDLDSQNTLLLDQIQQLNTQLTILQAQSSSEVQNTSIGDQSFSNRSFTEDDVKSSEQLLKIIKYLRQEKDIAVSKADIMEAEHLRLKSQYDSLIKQLEEAKEQLELERQKNVVSNVSAAKHAEVLRRLETLNAITDSNRTLRSERDALMSEITELRTRAEKWETEVAPLQELNRDLTTKADQMQNENISLRAECTRWRQRANMLIEKTNRTSPEDWKKLQTERETLAKQLTIERSTTTQLNDSVNNLKSDKQKLDEQLKSLRTQNNALSEEVKDLKEKGNSLKNVISQISQNLEKQVLMNEKLTQDIKVLTEDNSNKDTTLNEMKNNLAQIKKIAKKYKTQCEDQVKDLEALRQSSEAKESEQNLNAEKQEQLLQEQRSEYEEKIQKLETTRKEEVDKVSNDLVSSNEQIENLTRKIDELQQRSAEKEERFKTLFKNAKDRIVTLTEQNNTLKDELTKQGKIISPSESTSDSSKNAELLEKIESLQREKQEISEQLQQERDRLNSEIESLNQRISQLQRQLGAAQQGSKPSTSSAGTEKASTERPTADIKPMAGHSTNTQTQSVPIQPWRSGGEPPLASIRPMSQQLRTVAVLPTSQSQGPSAVMVPPQQQVHTTGSSTLESLSSSPTSSHTDYVPATSSASAPGGSRQVAVPPTQSSQDTADESESTGTTGVQQAQAQPQQALAVVSPRVEPPTGSSGSGGAEQGAGSSGSSNTVTTTQAGLKRQREADTEGCQEDQGKTQQQTKRTRLQPPGAVSSGDSGLEVEYQVPTSSQRDHDDDHVIVVESDEEGGPDEGEGADDDQDDPDTEGYDMEAEQDAYEDADCQDVDEEEEAGNEVEVIEDSSEVPNQSESQENEGEAQAQSEAISSGTDGPSGIRPAPSTPARQRPVAPLPYHRPMANQPMLLDECGDDGIVPSTPTLYVPRRQDGFGEAVNSPHVPTGGGRLFTFAEQPAPGLHLDDDSTGRSVPTTPLQSSPQEALPAAGGSGDAGQEDERAAGSQQGDAELPSLSVSGGPEPDDENRGEGSSSSQCMGPPPGTSSDDGQQMESEEMLEGDDGVSSEGEKPPVPEETGSEEEGREAEASPSTRRSVRGIPAARRNPRSSIPRGGRQSGPPTPIVWGAGSPGRSQDRGRGNYSPRSVARRARGRAQRPFGRF